MIHDIFTIGFHKLPTFGSFFFLNGFHVGMAMPFVTWIPWDWIFTVLRLEDLDPELFQAPSEKSVAMPPWTHGGWSRLKSINVDFLLDLCIIWWSFHIYDCSIFYTICFFYWYLIAALLRATESYTICCAVGSRFHRTQGLKVSRWKQHLQCFKGPGQWHRVGLLLNLHHHDVPHDNPIHECWAQWPLGFGQWAHGDHDDQDQNERRVRIRRKHQHPKHPKLQKLRWQVLRSQMLSFWQNFENEFRHGRPKTSNKKSLLMWGWDDEMICSNNSYNL